MDQLLDAPVRLVVKAPNQRVGDQTIECALSWTVRKLKAYISEVYPNKPKSEEQKLIYSGQLLHDHLTLKDVLRQYEDQNNTHIVHLVCTGKPEESGSLNNNHGSSDTDHPRNSNDGVRQRRVENQGNTNLNPLPQIYPISSAGSTYTVPQFLTPEQMTQQMMWMQQVYSQYMTQYLQYAQPTNSALQPTIAAHENQGTPLIPPQLAPPAQPRNVQRNENVRMNAQGGPVDDDDEEFGQNRDWLDWFYISSRALVLFSIVYFYSSLSRFVAVSLLVVMFYLYKTNWFQNRRRPRIVEEIRQPAAAQNNDDNNNRAQQAAARPAAVDPQEARETQEIENLMDADLDNPLPRAELGPSIFTVTWAFISGFFASLIPEQPAPLN